MGRGGNSTGSLTDLHADLHVVSHGGTTQQNFWQSLLLGIVLKKTSSQGKLRSLLTKWIDKSGKASDELQRSASLGGLGLGPRPGGSDLSLAATSRHASRIESGSGSPGGGSSSSSSSGGLGGTRKAGGANARLVEAFESATATSSLHDAETSPAPPREPTRAEPPAADTAQTAPGGDEGCGGRANEETSNTAKAAGTALSEPPPPSLTAPLPHRAPPRPSSAGPCDAAAVWRGSAPASALSDGASCVLCSECSCRIDGPVFMLNDRPYCCQRHRLASYHKLERARMAASDERVVAVAGGAVAGGAASQQRRSTGEKQSPPPSVSRASSGVASIYPSWI
ncbi:hypothetical protein EMIHUDRAFT_442101 [Emiliania huxleyi CCMP1516]|uniref:LIM zinc-binding domain-containing protein n=2 Tax=Emiliania huxleyi TaxID=2903 RepID=A0A0D3K7P9_EMIH1|nr:hypothetical protein EMIHUDRAFT_444150 [Emiliania huxleyi CCMP1516]XP_005784213.1 hypothetical protein EMIHUDRAFT_442101 [Emiliania huxleyi CCMP1516]EOD23379.1 hypothetical protein EMIHUDRAFT_444150 [Emiliania huxleyi CCMP1516]EOD31784.1 hypothetical protein EMIHUDRAFT_442101 [Emiliania huxleyi CCMP1516]|eukprot:XP_005775808.1 hypothetical protein EMIHUDRAFT_444150 [Emiliania huxleyi CCMP1516]